MRLQSIRVCKRYLALLVPGILVLTSGCDDDSGPGVDYTESRLELAQTLAENFIVPGYEQLESDITELRDATADFVEGPNAPRLLLIKDFLRKTRITWQTVAPFQFGPTGDVALRRELNTYPIDETKILDNIESGDYTLGSIDNIGAEGFPAIEYMLEGLGESNSDVVAIYKDDVKYGEYLTALIERVLTVSGVVVNAWSPTGATYFHVFTGESAAGTDVGSALSLVVNAYEFHLQRFVRDGKIGIPAGVRSAGVPRPSSIEAFYGGYSTQLLDVSLRSMKDIYTGTSDSSDDYSLEDYLVTIGFEDLAREINVQFDEVIDMAALLNDPLDQEIENDNQKVVDVFLEIQKLVPLIKSDMASAMGVIITNQDADGD